MKRNRTELRTSSICIAACVMAQLKAKRILKADIDSVRCAIAGWLANGEMPLDADDSDFLEEQTLRQLIELVG